MKKLTNLYIVAGCWLVLLCTASCKKFITVGPPKTEMATSIVFSDSLTAMSAMAGLYSSMVESPFGSTSYLASLSADEIYLTVNSVEDLSFFLNTLLSTNGKCNELWQAYYKRIYAANAIMEGVAASAGLRPSLKDRLTGEALTLRAFFHFNLLNFYGGIPYIDTTDYLKNTIAARLPVATVYQHIIDDLLRAKTLLPDTYPAAGRVRVIRPVATALLARAYLYAGKWTEAEAQSTELINNTALYSLLPDLDKVFLKNSRESILQQIPLYDNLYTNEGYAFYQPESRKSGFLTETLWQSFGTGDQRKARWIAAGSNGTETWHYPYKYKQDYSNATGAEYSVVFRLAEQYLIRAEARTQQNNFTGVNSAAADVDTIRHRAGLPVTDATTKAALLTAIEQERRWELFTEWGHRWFDLKRMGRVDAVMAPLKAGWTTNDALYPIPHSEVLVNVNMKQNPGY
ncbi:MAG: RagB/SusD family nutrient uptake outer membrane protein [Niastella sp.]|nr:RagB/SusD family nutrient uptake outer membrane protein [Niastella sp.]